jgi:hypothetical protein
MSRRSGLIRARISRLRLAAAAAGATAILFAGASASAAAFPARTVPAATAAESIGLNIGLGAQYPGSPDYFQGVLVPTVRDLGIKHVRTTMPLPDQITAIAAIKQLAEEGARVLLTTRLRHVSDGAGDTLTTDFASLKTVVTAAGLPAVEAIELPNEFQLHNSDNDWPATLHDYGAQLYKSIHTDPQLKGLIVLGPSVGFDKTHKTLPSFVDVCDVGNVHAYTENYPLRGYNSQRVKIRRLSDMYFWRKPTWMTETGASTALTFTHLLSAAETQQADTVIRELLGGLYDGYKRVYIFRIRDSSEEPKDSEAHFGLIRYDNTPKPSYFAVSRFLKTLRAAGAVETGGPIKGLFSIEGDTKYVQAVVFPGKAKTVVAIWRRGPILPQTTRTLGHLNVRFQVPVETAQAAVPNQPDPKLISKTELDLDMVNGPVLITLPASAGKGAADGRRKGR